MKPIFLLLFSLLILVQACDEKLEQVDVLILNGKVIDGSGNDAYTTDIAIKEGLIYFIGKSETKNFEAFQTIDAEGLIVSPGFIDPHTHSLSDLKSKDRNSNLNYLTQGVTTVMNGNDGEGPIYIDSLASQLIKNGIGTNTGFFVGHSKVRKAILGDADVEPDSLELSQMKQLVSIAMSQGAFGFSTSLYYAPSSYATTEEVIELTKEIREFGGLYDSHIRDESSYNIGLIEAVKEAIEIGEKANVPVHLAHIKALGVDVWGKSGEIIDLVKEAHERGIRVTADQYPWKASGTHIENALISRWVMAGGDDEYYERLNNKNLLSRIKNEISENLRKRGGADAILITADCYDTTMIGKTLAQISLDFGKDPVSMALDISRNGGARIASFNMNEEDILNFMKQFWVMTSSDGTKGHPRKYANYPEKYKQYVVDNQVLTLEEFIHKSSGLVANTFGMRNRGEIKVGYAADIVVFDKEKYRPAATFYNPTELTLGVDYVFVNGTMTIEKGEFAGKNSGRIIRKKE